jgi:hypothetical protein
MSANVYKILPPKRVGEGFVDIRKELFTFWISLLPHGI